MESASDHQALYENCIAEEGEEIIDCAFDLGKVHLAAVNADGNVSIFQRANRQDNWTKVQTLETSGSGNFCKVVFQSKLSYLLTSSPGNVSIRHFIGNGFHNERMNLRIMILSYIGTKRHEYAI